MGTGWALRIQPTQLVMERAVTAWCTCKWLGPTFVGPNAVERATKEGVAHVTAIHLDL